MASNGTTGDGAAALAGVNVSAAAQAAIRRAIEQLQPHVNEDPRLRALAQKLTAIGNPSDFDADRAATVAKALRDSERIAKSQDVSPLVRERAAEVSLELQRSHLQRHSAGGYETWEASAREAGLL